jgi:hypothetical protein
MIKFIKKTVFAYLRTRFFHVNKMGDDKVRAICDEFWEWRMRQSPEFASYCGDQRYCHLLEEADTKAFLGYEVNIE